MTYSTVKEKTPLVEKMHIFTLESGCRLYIICKKDSIQQHGMVCFNYGSTDNAFSLNGQTSLFPEGTANFLHNIINKDNAKLEAFINNGALTNSFINYIQTGFHFTSVGNFDENLALIIESALNPDISTENVERERAVILHAIKTTVAEPLQRCYYNMMSILYAEQCKGSLLNGSELSIKKITQNMLIKSHNAFYKPSNMAVICLGNFEEPEKLESIKNLVSKKTHRYNKNDLQRLYDETTSHKESITETLDTIPKNSKQYFCIGIKDNNAGNLSNIPKLDMLISLVAGKNSGLYFKLLSQGLIDEKFVARYNNYRHFGVCVFSGLSKEPEKILELLLKELNLLNRSGICDTQFEGLKRNRIAAYSKTLRSFNGAAMKQAECFAKNTDIIELGELYSVINKSHILDQLGDFVEKNNISLSIIKGEDSNKR